MLVIGAKGLAKEILSSLVLNHELENLVFFDDVNLDCPDKLFDTFKIIRKKKEAKEYFKTVDKRFVIGVGNPEIRFKLYHDFIELGGIPYTLIPQNCDLGHFEVNIAEGVTMGYNCLISNSISIGKGSLINAKATIGHDTIVGEFCEICPSANIAGNVDIGDFTFIGLGVIIYPKVKIGKNVLITAGSVVRKDIPDNSIVHGNPSKIIGKNKK